MAVERRKLPMQPTQIEHCIDPARKLTGRNNCIETNIIEKLLLVPCLSTQFHAALRWEKSEKTESPSVRIVNLCFATAFP